MPLDLYIYYISARIKSKNEIETIRNFTLEKKFHIESLGFFSFFLQSLIHCSDKINTFFRKKVNCTKHELQLFFSSADVIRRPRCTLRAEVSQLHWLLAFLRNLGSQGSHAGEKKNKSVSHRCELINLFYFKFCEKNFYFLSPVGPSCHLVEKHQSTLAPVHHIWLSSKCLARISGGSVLANND